MRRGHRLAEDGRRTGLAQVLRRCRGMPRERKALKKRSATALPMKERAGCGALAHFGGAAFERPFQSWSLRFRAASGRRTRRRRSLRQIPRAFRNFERRSEAEPKRNFWADWTEWRGQDDAGQLPDRISAADHRTRPAGGRGYGGLGANFRFRSAPEGRRRLSPSPESRKASWSSVLIFSHKQSLSRSRRVHSRSCCL